MTTKTDSVVPNRTKFTLWPIRWQMVALLVGLLLLLWLGIKAWRIGHAVQQLLGQQTAVQSLLENGLTNINPDDAEAMAQTVRTNFVVLRDETAFLMPMMPRLGWVPKVGPLLVAAPQLVEMGDAGTETAVYAVESLKPLLHILQSENSGDGQLPQLIQALADARPGLAKAAVSLDRVAAARSQITNLDQFPDRLQPLFAQADEWLPIAQDSLAVVQILPEIMGVNGRRTYLLLAQNEDELRATGGFISGVGTLTIENGDIQNLAFQDASAFDLQTFLNNSETYDPPPQPLYDLMGSQYFLLRDANYWPDFPYSAQQAIDLYRRVEPNSQIDGVIAIDQEFMRLLVAATGPVTVPDTGQVINAQNTIQSFRDSFNIQEGQTVSEWFRNRKAFLTTFATAIMNKVQGDFGSVDPVAFLKNIHLALNSRHLQLYMLNTEESAVLNQLNWDGRLENPAGQDFLLALDTNVGFSKTNMHMQRTIHYQVAINADHTALATLTLAHTHTNPPTAGEGCVQEISYDNAPTYQEIADRCYFNFLRVYSSPGATLRHATQHSIPAGILLGGAAWAKPATATQEFANFVTFSNFMMVPRGESLTTQFVYDLPATVVQQQDGRTIYQLWLRKQAGTPDEPYTVEVQLPAGSTAVRATASSAATIVQQEALVQINLNLQTDTLITVEFIE
ncbi:MAG: DUF4012 domain-containing protein [Ardenticatenaceae bacterium]|nr:DUF4012 domain-containing protein [Ardenticatenaceae bacterium]MCB8972804.1 DUF4012 domain-containing protein [Ardenticatenaceae bacterium]